MSNEYVTNSDESPIKLRVRAARRSRAAAGIAAITFLTVILGCVYRLFFRENPYGIQAIIVMGVVGIVLLNLGRTSRSKRMTELAILRFYKSFRFYGTVVSISASIVFCYALATQPAKEVHARVIAAAPAQEPKTVPQPEVVVDAPPQFPKLDLSGVILNGDRSSAIINLKTVTMGEVIEGVRLVEVRENSIVVEMEGYRKTISRFAMPGLKSPAKGS